MKAKIYTRRSERILEVSTQIYRGIGQVALRTTWIDDLGRERSSLTQWVPQYRLDELIEALRVARDELVRDVSR